MVAADQRGEEGGIVRCRDNGDPFVAHRRSTESAFRSPIRPFRRIRARYDVDDPSAAHRPRSADRDHAGEGIGSGHVDIWSAQLTC